MENGSMFNTSGKAEMVVQRTPQFYIILIFTHGHAPGHQSFLVNLTNSGYVLLTIDAAYTMDHWNNLTLPCLVCSAVDVVNSVKKLKKVAKEKDALIVTGHDPHAWQEFKKAPMFYYD